MPPGDSRPTVLVVEDRRELTDRLRGWLDDEYEVRTAYSGEEAQELHDEHVSVTCIDQRIWDDAIDELLEEIRERDYAGLVVSVSTEAEVSEPTPAIDHHLQRPLTRDEAGETIEHLARQAVYEEEIREWLSLLSEKAKLEQEMEPADLDQSPEYRTLMVEIEELRERASSSRDAIPDDRFDAVFREIGRGQSS